MQYANRVWGCEINAAAPLETAMEGIRRTTAFIRQLGLPANLEELGLGNMPEDIMQEIAMKATVQDTVAIGGIRKLGAKDIVNILRLAKKDL